ncbi:hypothetical protein HK099_006970 [Clydaea vesicula]|uniref:Methyltransferase FkbM domain-containing protein n=1 Tax=Clydaea vesicula TaxID=447962 RepID=A0AAD5U796_9FUNG|nr:hypothetical protein HK099_006970 [Clydaea vesicula]
MKNPSYCGLIILTLVILGLVINITVILNSQVLPQLESNNKNLISTKNYLNKLSEQKKDSDFLTSNNNNLSPIKNLVINENEKFNTFLQNSQKSDNNLFLEAKQQQKVFCSEYHPLELENVVLYSNPSKLDFTINVFKTKDIVSQWILEQGGWEMNEVDSFLRILRLSKHYGANDPTFLDIGSNIGWFSMNVANAGFNVISFDAMKKNGHLFRSSLCSNPKIMDKITFFNKGLSETEKTCIVISGNDNLGDGTIKCLKSNEKFVQTGYSVRETLNLVRLDEYVRQDIYLLKIDVEGFEAWVMDGATNLFKNYKVQFLMTEIGIGMMKGSGRDPGEYAKFLIKHGFECSTKDFIGPYIKFEEGKESEPLQKIVTDTRSDIFNLFCKHKNTKFDIV